jgi:hypothetical protein
MAEVRRVYLPHFNFRRHIRRNTLVALAAIVVALGGGMLGYVLFDGMDPVDAFLNAAMIISGMGPMSDPASNAGKIFAGCYAIFAGVMLVAIWGLILTPFIGWLVTRLHVTDVHPEGG